MPPASSSTTNPSPATVASSSSAGSASKPSAAPHTGSGTCSETGALSSSPGDDRRIRQSSLPSADGTDADRGGDPVALGARPGATVDHHPPDAPIERAAPDDHARRARAA